MKFACSNCQQRFEVEEVRAGESLICPTCGESLVVPSVEPTRANLPPMRVVTAPARSSIPPHRRRRREMPGFLRFFLYMLVLTSIAFGYAMFSYQESPQQVWKRIVNSFCPEETKLASIPTPTPTPTPVTVPVPTPASEPTATSVPTPSPSQNPLVWLLEHKNRWPKVVNLTEPQAFPAVVNGNVVGSATVPAGSAVTVKDIDVTTLAVVFQGGERKLPYNATNLLELAKLEMQRPASALTPAQAPRMAGAPASAPATVAATPFTGFGGNSKDKAVNEEKYDKTVYFDTSASGEEKSIKTWGAQTIGGPHVVQSCMDNMGANQVNLVLMMFFLKEPLEKNGELSAKTKAAIDEQVAIAKIAGNKPLALSPDTEGGINPWFHSNPREVFANRYADLLIALKKYIKHPIAWVQPFNEPDYGWNQGTQKNLSEIMIKLRSDASFSPTQMAGPAALNVDAVLNWFNAIKPQVSIATTHTLGGSFDSYVNFIKTVKSSGKTPFNPEIHNLVEAIAGAEYGLEGGIFWLDCTPTRGAFVKACQGKRLGYAEDRAKFSAAAVYRAPSGAVRAFMGSNERQGRDTTYRFVCRDREVRFDGKGPQKEYVATVKGNGEEVINITW